jgi:hypothetical protein
MQLNGVHYDCNLSLSNGEKKVVINNTCRVGELEMFQSSLTKNFKSFKKKINQWFFQACNI